MTTKVERIKYSSLLEKGKSGIRVKKYSVVKQFSEKCLEPQGEEIETIKDDDLYRQSLDIGDSIDQKERRRTKERIMNLFEEKLTMNS